MRECPWCWVSVPESDPDDCPVCGADIRGRTIETELGEGRALLSSPASQRGVACFRRRFTDRGFPVTAEQIHRAYAALIEVDKGSRRCAVLLVKAAEDKTGGDGEGSRNPSSTRAEFYGVCSTCIAQRGGVVVGFAADAVLALFGAPLALDRDTESGVRAGFDIRDRAAELTPSSSTPRPTIVLATGEVEVTGAADGLQDVTGAAVDEALRLLESASEGEVSVCPLTARRVSQWIECRQIEAPLRNGHEGPVTAFLAIKPNEESSSPLATPFCGREREVSSVARFLSGTGAKALGVIAEAGMGKTRLAREAIQRLGLSDCAIWWACDPVSQPVSLAPFLDWIRQEAGVSALGLSPDAEEAMLNFASPATPDNPSDALLLEYLLGRPHAIEALRWLPVGFENSDGPCDSRPRTATNCEETAESRVAIERTPRTFCLARTMPSSQVHNP